MQSVTGHALAGGGRGTLAAQAAAATAAVRAESLEAAAARPDLDGYTARVSASDRIELPGARGVLAVWIGLARNMPEADAGTVSATQGLGMRGQSATVAPFAPDFVVEPARTVCEGIVPSGSIVRFALSPRRAGTLSVGAEVQLFDSADCSGTPVPKSTRTISVQVDVCEMCYVRTGLASLGATLWAAFSQFWTWLVGIAFVTLTILINRWRKRRFHLTKDELAKGGTKDPPG